ncbi:DUF1413 domain-containing protein [Cytobacillus kochii]|uniref:DUF1413 domain-containing protein n=1 Tax=Cytobacillus kochii TaxID=859143 RepID=UPI00203EDBC3|nr:DUF1413 domain-containing protein [Cytobacillus kochii]MCM3325044.1 single-stranded DNA-binding protein [Cytobacillus kochii]MCM3347419.1 single-stranded DNA-binding protein [Cytobacillus kochii]
MRLKLSEEEYKDIYSHALQNGFASIPEYLRYLLFNEKPETTVDYEVLLKQFEHAVTQRKDNKEFKVRDCFDPDIWADIDISSRRTLGRMIIHKVEKGGWLPIVPTKKDSGNAQWYRKRSE